MFPIWCTGVNICNEMQFRSKGRIDKKGLWLIVGARHRPWLKGRWRAVRPPWTIYAFIHQSREHEAASWHDGCRSRTLSLISPRTLKVKNITVMIMRCLFIPSKAIFVSTEVNTLIKKYIKKTPWLPGCINTQDNTISSSNIETIEQKLLDVNSVFTF